MASIAGCITTSHVAAIGRAIDRGLQEDPGWKPFFDGFQPVHRWLEAASPDVAVVIYNDHGLNFFLDKMPTFARGAAPEYRNADEGWGPATVPPFPGHPALSWHMIESIMGEEFDLTTCQEMLVDHAVVNPMRLLWPDSADWPVRIVPIDINTVQHPLPSARRCWRFGEAIGRAINSYQEDLRVVVVGTGGLSHQLDGQQGGFINQEFDLEFMDSMTKDPVWATGYSTQELAELAGTQGVELMMWLAARATLLGDAHKVTANYHIPVSTTAAGLMLLEPAEQRGRAGAAAVARPVTGR
jgi:protocatechuate 4,5-dioxygenase, beta chain